VEYTDRCRSVDSVGRGLSDIDLDVSDDELDLVSNRNEYAIPTSPLVPGLDPEMIEVQVG